MRLLFVSSFSILVALAGCSSPEVVGTPDTGDSIDAGRDARVSGDSSVPVDVGGDAASRVDAGIDAASLADTGLDAASLVDTGIDAASLVDGGVDAASTTDVGVDGGLIAPDTGVDGGGGCTSDTDCLGTQFCEFAPGTCGGTGTCTSRGIGRFCVMTCAPECGCDGTTYQNGCYRDRAGVSLQANGVCPGSVSPCGTTTCGCAGDGDCRANEECITTGTGGVCKTKVRPPMCWRDSDCATGLTCHGASVCECGALCLIADHAGTCM